MTNDDTKALIDEWLKQKHTTLWGQCFDVSDDKSRTEAVDWFDAQMLELYDYISR